MNILSEILRGSWFLYSQNIERYSGLASGLLSGKFSVLGREKSSAVSILSEEESHRGEILRKNKVAMISMVGEMTKYNTDCNYGAEYFSSEIKKYLLDSEIKGIILMMDGPGGNADAIPLFQELKPLINKPIISLVDKACSLHYWVSALLSGHIMLSNDFMAECGSIGSMVVFEKPKDELVIIRPPESRDKNQAVVDALEGNYEKIEQRLSVLSQRFQREVRESRPMVKEEALLGKTYFGQEAIDMGLADSIGGVEQAYQWVLAKAELSKN